MKTLIIRSYEAICRRGLIKSNTKKYEFIRKLKEELLEVEDAYKHEKENRYIEELTDLVTVGIMQMHHLGYDFETEFEKVVIKNESRVKK